MSSSSDTFVIVGAGMAGGKAAETLREDERTRAEFLSLTQD